MELVILITAMKNNVSGEGAHSERVENDPLIKMANQDEWYCGNVFVVLLLMLKGHAIIVWKLCI